MRVPYNESIILSPDDGEPRLMFRPEVLIRVVGSDGQARGYSALVEQARTTLSSRSLSRKSWGLPPNLLQDRRHMHTREVT